MKYKTAAAAKKNTIPTVSKEGLVMMGEKMLSLFKVCTQGNCWIGPNVQTIKHGDQRGELSRRGEQTDPLQIVTTNLSKQ